MRTLRLSVPLVLALTLALLQPAAAAAGENPYRLDRGAGVDGAAACSSSPRIAKHYGKSYQFEPLHFSSSTLQITAISQGEIDIAAFGYTSFPLAIQNGGLTDLRIIADEIQDGAPGYYSTPYFVRKDSGINKIEDMKGKVAATNGLGSGVDIAMRSALHRHGLEVTRDYTMIEAPFPAHKAILKEKQGRSGRRRAAVLLRSGVERFRQAAVHHAVEHRQHRAVVLGGAQGIHRQEPRGAGRSAGRLWRHPALELRSGQPQGGGRADRGLPQAAAGGASRAGCSPSGTFSAIPTANPTSRWCSRASTR